MSNLWDISFVVYSRNWSASQLGKYFPALPIRLQERNESRLDSRVVIPLREQKEDLSQCVTAALLQVSNQIKAIQNECSDVSISLWITTAFSGEHLGFDISREVVQQLSLFEIDLVFSIYKE